jgi:hypothetical protein
MSDGKKFSRLELFVFAGFVLLILFFSVSRCNAKKEELRLKMEAESMEDQIQDSINRIAKLAKTLPPKDTTPLPPPEAKVETVREEITPLFVVLEELNMRAQPKLNGPLLARLQLYDEVYYLNEVSDFKQEINLGGVVYNEPWVKVKNQRGQIGWVYGAGVHYYKFRRPG